MHKLARPNTCKKKTTTTTTDIHSRSQKGSNSVHIYNNGGWPKYAVRLIINPHGYLPDDTLLHTLANGRRIYINAQEQVGDTSYPVSMAENRNYLLSFFGGQIKWQWDAGALLPMAQRLAVVRAFSTTIDQGRTVLKMSRQIFLLIFIFAGSGKKIYSRPAAPRAWPFGLLPLCPFPPSAPPFPDRG